VKNLTGLDGADVSVRQGEYGDSVAFSRDELHFIRSVVVAVDDRPHVPGLEACVRESSAENHRI
jgi:hypothetical protein